MGWQEDHERRQEEMDAWRAKMKEQELRPPVHLGGNKALLYNPSPSQIPPEDDTCDS